MLEAILRYTVKDKSIINLIFFIFGCFVYFGYLIYDFKNQEGIQGHEWWQREFAFAKRDDIAKIELTGVLLGGSNVAYSLSAQTLDELTNFKWFNFGLSSEAKSDKNYWGYITGTLNSKQRSMVELAVYSGVQLYNNGYIRQRELETGNIWGQRPLGIVPNQPLYKVIKQSPKKRGYPLPLSKGDFDFEKMVCPQDYSEAFEREENWLEARDWIEKQITNIRGLFPNADVLFILPSEFYGEAYDPNYDQVYFDMVNSYINDRFHGQIHVYAQPQYPDKSLTCDARHHGNFNGRQWRTKNLADYINASF